MLYGIWLKIVNMSMTASIVIAAVLLLRLVLRKAPKVYSYLLWFIVLFRLLCPVSVSSAVSLIGLFHTPVSEEGEIAYLPYAGNAGRDIMASGYKAIPNVSVSEKISGDGEAETVYELREALFMTAGTLWLAGAAGLILYSVIRLAGLLGKLSDAVKTGDGTYRTNRIGTPFVLGVIFPRIYLPSGLTDTEKEYILMHEKHHIKRGDHIYKLLFYAALCIYWFNPLVWVAFCLFERDMEMSCDEAVMRRMTSDIRAEYSASLLCFATGRRMAGGMPLAFGEGDTGERIRNILKWKKPKRVVVVAALLLCAAAAVCLSTNPKASDSDMGADSGINADSGVARHYSVEEALRAAVIKHYQPYAVPADFSCAGIVICSADMFASAEEADAGKTAVYYIYAMYKDMDIDEEGITELVTIPPAPMAITLIQDAGGGYRVEEDGGIEAVNRLSGEKNQTLLKENFPESHWEDGSCAVPDVYQTLLCMDCHAQAVEYARLDTEAIIDGLAGYIANQPLASSATQDYIRYSPVEYRELIYYGKYTLEYANEYRQTGAADLKMAVLDCASAEILGYNGDSGRGYDEGNDNAFTGIIWPTTGSAISQAYGNQQGNDGKEYFSDHICIAGSEGDPVYAAMDGVVETTGFSADDGNYIVILSGDGIRTRYGYLRSVGVEEGMQVTAGEEIGTVGKTGRATGNCLSFAVTDNGNPVDPTAFIVIMTLLEDGNEAAFGKTIYLTIDSQNGSADDLETLLEPERRSPFALLNRDAAEGLIQYMRDNGVRIAPGVYKIPQTASYEELTGLLEFE